MRVALISMDQVWCDKPANLEICRYFVRQAKHFDSELVIFPEMTLTGFSMNANDIAEDEYNSETLYSFSKLAADTRIDLIAGVVLKTLGRPSNYLVHFDKTGAEKARYSKIHPFSYSLEDQHYVAGQDLITSSLCDWRLGFSICYDLRFPVLYTALAKNCDMLINIANWPKARIDHWHTLLKARAIENQVYMLGINRVGTDGNGLVYQESSQVVDAYGNQLQPIAGTDGLQVYTLDRRQLQAQRSAFPTVHDKRYDLYRTFL